VNDDCAAGFPACRIFSDDDPRLSYQRFDGEAITTMRIAEGLI
jgi:hypothetical protein